MNIKSFELILKKEDHIEQDCTFNYNSVNLSNPNILTLSRFVCNSKVDILQSWLTFIRVG